MVTTTTTTTSLGQNICDDNDSDDDDGDNDNDNLLGTRLCVKKNEADENESQKFMMVITKVVTFVTRCQISFEPENDDEDDEQEVEIMRDERWKSGWRKNL